MNNRLQQYIPTVISALLCVCALGITVLTLYVLVISHWHGPFRDMWEIYPFLQKIIAGTWTLNDLWESYGYAHRLFLPRLLFIADHQYFDANNHLLIAVSVTCQLLICGLFALLLWREDSISLAMKYGLIAIVVCLQFSATLLFNFMHTFDVQWFLCCFFIVFSFYILSRFSSDSYVPYEKSTAACLIVSGFLIAAACLNNFSAMAAWPIWFLFAFEKLKNLKFKIIVLSPILLFIAFYVYGIRSDAANHGIFINGFMLLPYILVIFPFVYLSNPLSDGDFISLGYGSAIVVIPAMFMLARFWWNYLLNRDANNRSQLHLFLACIGLFGYGVALITAMGRGYDFSHVHAMRYQNIVLLFWSAIILLAILQTRALGAKAKYLLRAPFVITLFGFLWCQPLSWNQNVWLGYQVNRAHLALMMGFSSNVPMIAPTVSRSMIYVAGYNLEHERALYEASHKGVYQGDLASLWLNRVSLAQIDRVCQDVSWTVSPYEGPYTRYISFGVTGDTRGFNQAVLVDAVGRVQAMAISEGSNNLLEALQSSWGLRPSPLRGFAITEAEPVALILMYGGGVSTACKLLLSDKVKARQ